jgi:hypothetical protein
MRCKPEVLRSGALWLLLFAAVTVAGCIGAGDAPSVWVMNSSNDEVAFFVSDNSSNPAAWYVVGPHTSARAGSAGLGSPDVRINVLGWQHEANNVSACSPGDYPDTLYDVPRGAAVRLLIGVSGEPSVAIAPEPSGLPVLAQVPLGNLSEAGRCAFLGR